MSNATAGVEAGSDEVIEVEQRHVSRLYRRLDDLRAEAARRLRSVLAEQTTSHQERSQRDAATTMYGDRIAQLDAVENGLCFGRLDFTDGQIRHIGRIGIHQDGYAGPPLLVDWRAPGAQPFYLATVMTPDGVSRRRHIDTRDRRVVAAVDEALDARAAEPAAASMSTGLGASTGAAALTSESALIAALSAHRTGTMRDIVETIQAEQDEIIRGDLSGVLVVEGGPGTGKTAVALHRAAYLLYHHREALSRRAVLIIGPNALFLRYIGQVLPGLGETSVVLSTIGDLFPGVRAGRPEPDPVSRIKGRAGMAAILANAVRDRQAALDEPWQIEFDREPLVIEPGAVARARRRARASRLPHNQARPIFADQMIDLLARQVADRIGADPFGGPSLLTDDDVATIRDELRASPTVTGALDELWPDLTPQRLLADLFADPSRLDVAAPDLAPAERESLRRAADPGRAAHGGGFWSVADVPLLDEAAELLGVDERAKAARAEAEERRDRAYAGGVLDILSRDLEDDPEILMAHDLIDADRLAGRQVAGDDRTVAERAAADRQWAYGHVIVDEAQELSPMAWRMLMRRCPSRSMTLVGDAAQTSDPGAAGSWSAALEPFVARRWRLERLTVNYRTPAEIAEVAEPVRRAVDPDGAAPRAIRSAGTRPWRRQAPTLDALGVALNAAIDAEAAAVAGGRIGVLVPAALMGAEFIPERAADLADQVTILPVRQAKGLEFDSVLVVEPRLMLDGPTRGAGDLYVALTRATKRLGILHTGPIPEVLSGVPVG